MTNMNLKHMEFSTKDLRTLQDIWLRDWQLSHSSDSGLNVAERWVNSVLEMMRLRGDEVISRELREHEERIMALGLSQEYMSTLSDVVDAEDARSEYDKAVLILTASAEERAEALRLVLEGDHA